MSKFRRNQLTRAYSGLPVATLRTYLVNALFLKYEGQDFSLEHIEVLRDLIRERG